MRSVLRVAADLVAFVAAGTIGYLVQHPLWVLLPIAYGARRALGAAWEALGASTLTALAYGGLGVLGIVLFVIVAAVAWFVRELIRQTASG
jgi:hypothetical protein